MVSIGCLVVSEEVIVAAVCCQVWFVFSSLYSNRRDGLDVLEPNGVDERIIRWKHLAAKSWKAGKDKMISCKHKEGQCEPERSQITANGDECQGSLVMAQNWSLIYHLWMHQLWLPRYSTSDGMFRSRLCFGSWASLATGFAWGVLRLSWSFLTQHWRSCKKRNVFWRMYL